MSIEAEFLNPSEAAGRLGVSIKALRLYERRGLIDPVRTASGWRTYGPDQMRRAAEIVALRRFGFGLAQIAHVLDAGAKGLEDALAAHQATIEAQLREAVDRVERLRQWRRDLADGQAPDIADLLHTPSPPPEPAVAFDLPWPWGDERFELCTIRPLTYIVGPLFSGKTRLIRRLAEELPDCLHLGVERLDDSGAAAKARMESDPALKSRVEKAMAWLLRNSATRSDALIALLVGLEAEGPDSFVIDMVEHGLEPANQRAVIGYLRRRDPRAPPVFMTTRSCEILDLRAVGPQEAIILCPANHAKPVEIEPCPGAPGYDAVATCLAPPAARARTHGVVACRPPTGGKALSA